MRLRGWPAPASSKYRAQPVVIDGIRFPSKLQASVYGSIKLLQRAGEVHYFLREVPLHLPGGVIYRVDFLVFYADGRVRYLDAKGVETPVFKTKCRVAEATYPVKIETVRRERGRLVGL